MKERSYTYYIIIMRIGFSVLSLGVIPSISFAQDLEETYFNTIEKIKTKPISAYGIISVNGNGAFSNIEPSRVTPFAGSIQAALVLDILGISAPFSINATTGSKAFNYNLPAYSFLGISPSYRWATVHLGDRSMDLGKYTFSNQSFRGAGFELKPGKWTTGAFYGQMRRSTPSDFNSVQRLDPIFRRIGIGGKVGYESGKDKAMISVLRAWDEYDPILGQDSLSLFNPAENMVVSGQVSKMISEKIFARIEYAFSAFTDNVLHTLPGEDGFIKSFAGSLKTNQSTRWGNAYNGEVGINTKVGDFSVGAEKVDPGFKTMGALFFRNDLQNFTGSTRLRFWKKRLSVQGRAGIQQNNLSSFKSNGYVRGVGMINFNGRLTDRIDVNFSYSSFNNVTRRTSLLGIGNPISVEELVLTNNTISAGANYIFENSKVATSVLQFLIMTNKGNSILNDDVLNDQASSRQYSIMALRQKVETPVSYGLNVSRIENQTGTIEIISNSLGLQFGKQFNKETISLNAAASYGANSEKEGGSKLGASQFFTANATAAYKLSEKASLSFSATFYTNRRSSPTSTFDPFSESRILLAFQQRIGQ